jgi:hypothetical protein
MPEYKTIWDNSIKLWILLYIDGKYSCASYVDDAQLRYLCHTSRYSIRISL